MPVIHLAKCFTFINWNPYFGQNWSKNAYFSAYFGYAWVWFLKVSAKGNASSATISLQTGL